MKHLIVILVKALVCGFIFFFGTILGGILASAVGFPVPSMPDGTNSVTLAGYLLLASLGIGALLSYLASRLGGKFLLRWLTLSFFSWVIYSLGTYIEATIYTTFSSASPYKLVMDLVAFFASSAAAVLLFRANPSVDTARKWGYQTLSNFSFMGWAWRTALAWGAFPLIYISVGKLIEPLVIDYYRQGWFELTAPDWEQIIIAQMLRSLLFLGIFLAVIARWNRSRFEFWVGVTAAFYLLAGGFYMLQAYWFPMGFRMVHCVEIFVDAIIYAGCLTLAFMPKEIIPVSKIAPFSMAKQN